MSNIPEVPLWTACTINDEVLPESTTPEYEFEYVDISSVSQGRVSDNLELQIFESAPSRARRLARPRRNSSSTGQWRKRWPGARVVDALSPTNYCWCWWVLVLLLALALSLLTAAVVQVK